MLQKGKGTGPSRIKNLACTLWEGLAEKTCNIIKEQRQKHKNKQTKKQQPTTTQKQCLGQTHAPLTDSCSPDRPALYPADSQWRTGPFSCGTFAWQALSASDFINTLSAFKDSAMPGTGSKWRHGCSHVKWHEHTHAVLRSVALLKMVFWEF